jgi:hypothetical protein
VFNIFVLISFYSILNFIFWFFKFYNNKKKRWEEVQMEFVKAMIAGCYYAVTQIDK